MPEFSEVPPETVHRWIGDDEAMSAFDPELIPVDTGKKVVFICAQGL